MHLRAKLMIYLNSLLYYGAQNKVHFVLTVIVFSQNGSGPSKHDPRGWSESSPAADKLLVMLCTGSIFSTDFVFSVTFHAFVVFCCLFSKSDFFTKKNISATLSECQTVWIKIRTDILLVLIWVQTVCKGYQQMTKGAASKEMI